MSLVDDLADTSYLEDEVKRLRELAFDEEAAAHRHRAKADVIELEIVERRTAVGFLQKINLRVDRDPEGVPRVYAERLLADEPDGRMDPETQARLDRYVAKAP